MEYSAVYSALGHNHMAIDEKINPSNARLNRVGLAVGGFFCWYTR